jgi:lysophospholipase L1-like esterase
MNTKPSAKSILVYGDSISYGRMPKPLKRHPSSVRWTGILQKELGDEYEIVEEGLRARMLFGDNPHFRERDGFAQFGPILGSHLPLDLIVIFLGTNDLNEQSAKSPEDIANQLDGYFKRIDWWISELQIETPPEVLIVSPPHINEECLGEVTIFKGAGTKSRALAPLYQAKAEEHNSYFFDAAIHTNPSNIDGVHLDEAGNLKLGLAIAPVIRKILA